MVFSYDMITDDSAREIYNKILRGEAMKFLGWRAAKPHRATKSLAVAFENWWMTRGATKVVIDAIPRFKRELYGRAVEISGHA